MSDALVEVACFNFATDPKFLLFINYLESEGIPYACPERLQLETQPFLSIGLGGLRVLVHGYNLEKAQALLESIVPPEPDETLQNQASLAEVYTESAEPLSNSWHKLKLIFALLLVAYLIYKFVVAYTSTNAD
jgi:hypothetical protein